jgi:phage terminase large subunit
MSASVTPAIERIAFPAGGLQLYRHQQETWDARRVHGRLRRIANDHRQSGKDVGGLVDLFDAAIHEPGVYAYVAPTRQMAENIAWHGVRATDGGEYLSILPPQLLLDRNEADLALEIATLQPGKHSRVLFLSGNEPARLRGLPLKGVVFTEFAQFTDSEALDTVLPTLNRSGGWLLVLSTPLGLNHYHQLWQMAQASPEWWTATRTIEDTVDHDGRPLIDPAIIERELEQGQRLDWLHQEYRCQFVVGLVASIFGDVLTRCEQEGRILDLPRREHVPTVVAFDLGLNDSTVAVWIQAQGEWFDVVDVEAWQNLTLTGVIQRVQARGWLVRDWLAPHDLHHREFSAEGAGGQAVTRERVAQRAGVRFKIAPKLSLSDGLDAVRRVFSRLRFDRKRTAKLVEALSQYQRAWDPEARVYADRPLHNWCSDYADALRTFAVSPQRPARDANWKPAPSKTDFSVFDHLSQPRPSRPKGRTDFPAW